LIRLPSFGLRSNVARGVALAAVLNGASLPKVVRLVVSVGVELLVDVAPVAAAGGALLFSVDVVAVVAVVAVSVLVDVVAVVAVVAVSVLVDVVAVVMSVLVDVVAVVSVIVVLVVASVSVSSVGCVGCVVGGINGLAAWPVAIALR
jgi:hypothetical protein